MLKKFLLKIELFLYHNQNKIPHKNWSGLVKVKVIPSLASS